MKTSHILTASLTALTVTLSSCGEKKTTETKKAEKEHDHSNCDHDPKATTGGSHDHDGDGENHKEHAGSSAHDHDDHGHSHDKKVAGPNGGRVITVIEPHAEFLVTPERKVRITFLNEENKAVALGEQSVRMVCGDRNHPSNISFSKEADGMSLLSNETLPKGNQYDTHVTFKMTAEAKPARAKFSLNMNPCSTCDHLEYACTCAHAH
ncbi:hypothetical protein HW115_16000 [Verrucomicrobiaceae bacterium N1E253]|uniref:Uncharacterized protein n=1 Tax=Oceaniferula marina TaxID=2748318 RepID=A0A851GPS9_9BACT|nr:hypothetical protein [Oceaniferula marina]NWK57125.1 hypothetical protein [Oceaniferula marina]